MLNNISPEVIDNLLPEIDDEEEPIPSLIEHVKMAQAFIEKIKKATYDNGKLDPSVIERLRNPTEEIVNRSWSPIFFGPLHVLHERIWSYLQQCLEVH